jgi:hypothetical protein
MKATSLAKAIAVAGTISISSAVSAFAQCDNYIATATNGFGNRATMETWGDHYASVDQDGDFNRLRGRIQGHCNAFVAGQYGNGNRTKSNIAGSDNDVGMLQNTDHARARANVVGDDNGIFSSQSRRGSRASFDVAGEGNRIVNIQH